MNIYDLHIHSLASCDSRASIFDMCKSAIQFGVKAVAFTEHVELNPSDACYGKFDYSKTKKLWKQAQSKYKDKLTILFGAEVTYWSHLEEQIRKYLKTYPFDVIIGSIHDAPPINFWDPLNADFVRNNPDQAYIALKNYFTETKKLAASGLFDIVGHLGVYERRIPDAWPDIFTYGDLEHYLTEALEAIAKNSRLEINASVIHKPGHWAAPRAEVLNIYRQMGGLPPTFGSDAHRPSQVGANWDLAREVLHQAGYSEFAHWKHVVNQQGPFCKSAQKTLLAH